jgi:1-acyl-sn-glycerol-3-phosphate acyltransferase
MRRRLMTVVIPLAYWSLCRVLRVVLVIVGRWKVYGRSHVPHNGALIIASNHLSNADPPILSAAITCRRIRFMAKVELFRGWFGVLVRLWGAFPVRRFEADVGAMLNAERSLKRGEVLGMFPEGTRSRTGRIGQPHPGTALIALRSGATVLPCAVTGTDRLKKPKALLTKPRITVRIGEPFQVEAVRRPTEEQVSTLTNRIFSEIRALLPEAYGGTYTGEEGAAPGSHGRDHPGE